MQESLGGNAKTSLVIAVANAEEHVDESLQSLQFGSRAMRILTRAVVNERTDVKVDIAPEILAQLSQTEDQANALALTLLAKENELEQIQGDLQASTTCPTLLCTATALLPVSKKNDPQASFIWSPLGGGFSGSLLAQLEQTFGKVLSQAKQFFFSGLSTRCLASPLKKE